MRAFVINEFGQPGKIAEVPDAQPRAGEVLIRVRTASVNPMDAFVASGAMAQYAEMRMPLIPGLDAVGTVEAVGPGGNGTHSDRVRVGDEVVVTAATKPFWGAGTFAELVAVPAEAAARKPAEVDDATAAAVPQAGLTALGAIDALDPKAGDDIAVIGSTGGVGSWFVQLAKIRGARVLALARPENADYARSLGADAVVDYTADGWTDELRAAVPDGLDALADFSGNTQLIDQLSSQLRPGGKLASSAAQLDAESYAARGLTAAQANRTDPARMTELLELLAAGQITAPAARVVPFEEIGDALDQIASRHTAGKVLVQIA